MRMRHSLISAALMGAVGFAISLGTASAARLTVLSPIGGPSEGALVADASGALYATTIQGGTLPCRCGMVLKLTPGVRNPHAWKESTIYSFGTSEASDGAYPVAGLVADASGALYGTTSQSNGAGYGTVFKLTPQEDGAYRERVLYSFGAGGASDGEAPYGNLVLDSSGALYGTTTAGGAFGGGTVFKLTPTSGGGYTESLLHSFVLNSSDGSYPRSGLVLNSKGAIFGTTQKGAAGANCGFLDCGTVFELTPAADGYRESILHTFAAGANDGFQPIGGLAMDPSGALYGTTSAGGSLNCPNGCGTVFKLTPAADGTYAESILYFFKGGKDGAVPFAGLSIDAHGVLYGTTYDGGGKRRNCAPLGCGTVFELTPADGRYEERVLYSFTGGEDGANPSAALFSSTRGALFGATLKGGALGEGTVFELRAE